MNPTLNQDLNQPLLVHVHSDEEGGVFDEEETYNDKGAATREASMRVIDSVENFFDNLLKWFLLPSLLLLHFSVTFSRNAEGVEYIEFSQIFITVICFCISSHLYRQACDDSDIECEWILYLPECCMDALMGLILFRQVELAFTLLIVCKIVLNAVVILLSIRLIVKGMWEYRQESKALNKQLLLL
jgi:FlaA1/EpsC-like NDP-sugar epimerase